MLIRSMKYYWQSTYKIILLMNLYLLLTTGIGVATLAAGVWNTHSEGITTLGAILFILYVISIVFVSNLVVIYIAVHFYRNMYSDEAYLTHTLPVSKHHLLLSQTIIGTIHCFLTSVIMLACIFGLIYFLFTCLNSQAKEALQLTYDPGMAADLYTAFANGAFFKGLLIVFYFLLSSAHSILLAFAAVAMGQLFTRHRIIGSIICYIGLYTIIQIATSLVVIPFMGLSLFGNVSMVQLINCGLLVETLFALACCVIFYLITYYLLSRKLNLD
ncbi:MAG: hypothetical protein PHE02_06745 [Lachnospiraceae bacterium]|nr:hypothetical protein [Lachnospiraceae bacterium]